MKNQQNYRYFFKQRLTRFDYIKALFLIATLIAIALFLVVPIIFISVSYNWYQLMPSYFIFLKILSPLLVCYLILATLQRLLDTGLSYKNSFICFSFVLLANFTNSKMLIAYLQKSSKPVLHSMIQPIQIDHLVLVIIGYFSFGLLIVILFLPSSYFKTLTIQSLAKKKHSL